MSKHRPVPRWVKTLFWIWFIVPVGFGGPLLDYRWPAGLILSVIAGAIAVAGPFLLIVLCYGKDAVPELFGASPKKDGADSKDIANLVP